MQYLLAAYGAIWIFLVGYFALTLSRSLAAAREIAALTHGADAGAPAQEHGREAERP